MNTEYIEKPETSHKDTRYRRAHRAKVRSQGQRTINYLVAWTQEELTRVDTNMKVSEFKAIKSRELLIVESYGKNGVTVTVLALKALINTI